ncbi:MAG: ABC transporter ATP-binding protein [Pseudomonadota bacterium]
MSDAGRPPLLQARDLTRVLEETVPVTLCEDVSLSVDRGELVAVTGPSGSGKSSLLYLLGLLDMPTHGEVLLNGRPTHELSEEERARARLETIGFVFQFHFLLAEFTALENIMIPMRRLHRLSPNEQTARAEEILASLGLRDHMQKRPDQLSGGQRQRVAVARALANDPPLVLADEPTGSLDTHSSEQVFEILYDLVTAQGRTVVAVTHDIEMADRMGRRIRLVDGRVVDDAKNTAFKNPAFNC